MKSIGEELLEKFTEEKRVKLVETVMTIMKMAGFEVHSNYVNFQFLVDAPLNSCFFLMGSVGEVYIGSLVEDDHVTDIHAMLPIICHEVCHALQAPGSHYDILQHKGKEIDDEIAIDYLNDPSELQAMFIQAIITAEIETGGADASPESFIKWIEAMNADPRMIPAAKVAIENMLALSAEMEASQATA